MARGTEVPTRFVVEGSTLTQVVDHATATFAYPITADPAVWSWWGVTYYLNKWETFAVAMGTDAVYALAGRAKWRGPSWLVYAALTGAMAYANFVLVRGGCIALTHDVYSVWTKMPRIWHYYGGYCRW